MKNRFEVEVKRGQYAWAHHPRGGTIEGRIMKITGRGVDAYVTFENGQTASLDDVTQTLGEMQIKRDGTVKQNPLLRVKVGSPSQRPHRTDDGGESTAPTARLKSRRRKTAKAPRGVYANPSGSSALLAILVNAGNDRNGNARRGWIIVRVDGSNAEKVGFVDHGYSGTGALRMYEKERGILDPIAQVGEFPIPTATYRELKRDGVSYG